MITELLTGLALMIQDAGLGVWNTDQFYTADQVGITIVSIPEAPDNLIVLSPYPVSDSMLNDSVLGVQIRCRGGENPLTVLERDAALFNLFEFMHDTTIGGVPVTLMWRQSGLAGPQDENSRWECSSNYYLRIVNPTLYRVD